MGAIATGLLAIVALAMIGPDGRWLVWWIFSRLALAAIVAAPFLALLASV